MRHKVKFAFIFVFLVLLSGCSVKYDIDLSENLYISENIFLTETYSVLSSNAYVFYDTYDDESHGAHESIEINYISDMERRFVSKYLPSDDSGNSIFYDNTISRSNVNDSASPFSIDVKTIGVGLSDLKTEAIFYRFSDNINCELNENIFNISIRDIYKEYIDQVDSFTINIRAPYEAISNNADKVTVDGGIVTYTWIYDDVSMIDINLSLDTTTTINKKNESNNRILFAIIIGAVLLIGLGFGIVMYNKSRHNNNI